MSKPASRRCARSAASVQVVSPMLLLVLMVLMLTPPVVSWCPKMGQSCGPMYPCCECDPNNQGRKLYCDYQWGQGFVCGTYAFEPRCDAGRGCSADGACMFNSNSQLEERIREAFELPRKISKLGK